MDNLAEEIGADPVTGEGTEENGMSWIDHNEIRSRVNATAIMAQTAACMEPDTVPGGRMDDKAASR